MRNFPPSKKVILPLLLVLLSSAVARTEAGTYASTTGIEGNVTQSLSFSMVPPGPGPGSGDAQIQVEGTTVGVQFEAEGLTSSSNLELTLVANGTSHSVANITASGEGEAEAEASLVLSQGTYSLGLVLSDASNPAAPTTVLVSSPAARTAVLGGQITTQTSEQMQSVSTYSAGEADDQNISRAIQSSFIPAVVDIGEHGSTVQVNDRAFSVSVGTYRGDGYVLSVSAKNVTGPRVLLVNLSSAVAPNLYLSSMSVTLDGAQVQQASMLSQVMGNAPGSQPLFIVISGSSGVSLLVLIPHFSAHSITIVPVLTLIGSIILYDLPVLLAGVAAVTLVFVFVYGRRTRFAA